MSKDQARRRDLGAIATPQRDFRRTIRRVLPSTASNQVAMNRNDTSALAARMRGKTKRALLRAPIINHLSHYQYLARLGRHAENLPWLTRDNFDLVCELRDKGIAIRDATTLLPPAVIRVADRFVDGLRNRTTGIPSVDVSSSDLEMNPEVYRWGLENTNLDVAEYYIGLPVRYMGVGVKREQADGIAAAARQWHIDCEDRRMLKIIVYLSDVTEGCGPFEYVNREESRRAIRSLHYASGYVSDSDMRRIVPESQWIRVSGARLTAIFVDTSQVFHRGQPPTTADRYSMTFTYLSTTPYQTFPEFMLSQASLADLHTDLTTRQRLAAMAD